MIKEPLDLILLVDDDEDDNFFHTHVIKKAQAAKQVESVFDGQEALDFLTGSGKYINRKDQPPPNLIFLDINMPRMDGWEFLDAYEHLPPNKQAALVIIMLTTSFNPDDENKAKKRRMVAQFLRKPLKQEDLLQVIRENFPTHF